MIVGVITACKYSDTEFFRVVDLRKIDNKIYIEGHMYSPEWNNPIIGSWHHWIAIKNDISEMELRIRELSNLYY